MGGSKTGTLTEIFKELLQRNLPVEVIEIDATTPFAKIVSSIASAAVFVGFHGAGLSHAAWLKPGSTLFEVICRGSQLYEDRYHKSDFANMSRFYGAKYVYYDAEAAVVTDERIKIVRESKGMDWEQNIEVRCRRRARPSRTHPLTPCASLLTDSARKRAS